MGVWIDPGFLLPVERDQTTRDIAISIIAAIIPAHIATDGQKVICEA